MSEKIYIIRQKDGSAKIIKEGEAIRNAIEQEEAGVVPHYVRYDWKNRRQITPPGWLVWSDRDGCGVVYRRSDGRMICTTGRQGDFGYF